MVCALLAASSASPFISSWFSMPSSSSNPVTPKRAAAPVAKSLTDFKKPCSGCVLLLYVFQLYFGEGFDPLIGWVGGKPRSDTAPVGSATDFSFFFTTASSKPDRSIFFSDLTASSNPDKSKPPLFVEIAIVYFDYSLPAAFNALIASSLEIPFLSITFLIPFSIAAEYPPPCCFLAVSPLVNSSYF